MKARVLVASVAAMVCVVAGCSANRSVGPAARPADPSSGSGASLAARWWQWVERFPPDADPVADLTGQSCAAHQSGDVWFLAGTYGGSAHRSCEIPAGIPVFFPVLNQICAVGARQKASATPDDCSFPVELAQAKLDGRPVKVSEETSGGPFTFTARQGSSTGFRAGEQDAVAWGMWVGPLTLTKGRHSLSFVGRSGSFGLDVTYDLVVR